ncbi:hypothetical protein GBF38_009074 [Nibea albiflora]|uniref:Uncharacterized protein n=1 Tax=Nibea albiflora TaxID=240163 RepID=A0ACB7ES60_NIBAL|nr:hypothetical protein GBF38_009074 [Nibea albiflora]
MSHRLNNTAPEGPTCVVSVVLSAPSAAQTPAAAGRPAEYGLEVKFGHEAARGLFV